MTVMPPPAWAMVAAALVMLFSIASATVMRSQHSTDASYSRLYSFVLSGFGGLNLGLLLAMQLAYKPGFTYAAEHPKIIFGYIVGEWVVIICALCNSFRNYGVFTLKPISMELFLNGMACCYLFALACNQLAAIASSPNGGHEALKLGAFVFGMTSVAAIMTLASYLSTWTESRFNSPAPADGKTAQSNTAKPNTSKEL